MTKKRTRLCFLSRQRPQLEALESRDLLAVNLVADVNQIGLNSSNPRELVLVGDQTYFVADSKLGTELWRTDGTSAGTVIVRDIVEGPGSSHPTDLVEVNGLLFFEAQTADGVTQVWRTDGTSGGTFSVAFGEITAVTDRQVVVGSLLSPGFAGAITDGKVAGT